MALEAQKAPVSVVDPFCREFFEDPFCAHEELREAGPVVRLSRYDVWAVARYAEVQGSSMTGRASARAAASASQTLPKRNRGGRRAWCWRPTRHCTTRRAACSTVSSPPRL